MSMTESDRSRALIAELRSSDGKRAGTRELLIGLLKVVNFLVPFAAWPLLAGAAALIALDLWVPSFNSWSDHYALVRTFIAGALTIAFTALVTNEIVRRGEEARRRPFADQILKDLCNALSRAQDQRVRARASYELALAAPGADRILAREGYISGAEEAWRTFDEEWRQDRAVLVDLTSSEAYAEWATCERWLREDVEALQDSKDKTAFPPSSNDLDFLLRVMLRSCEKQRSRRIKIADLRADRKHWERLRDIGRED